MQWNHLVKRDDKKKNPISSDIKKNINHYQTKKKKFIIEGKKFIVTRRNKTDGIRKEKKWDIREKYL